MVRKAVVRKLVFAFKIAKVNYDAPVDYNVVDDGETESQLFLFANRQNRAQIRLFLTDATRSKCRHNGIKLVTGVEIHRAQVIYCSHKHGKQAVIQ